MTRENMNNYLNSVIVRDFESLREEVYAQEDIQSPNGDSSEADADQDAGRRFCR